MSHGGTWLTAHSAVKKLSCEVGSALELYTLCGGTCHRGKCCSQPAAHNFDVQVQVLQSPEARQPANACMTVHCIALYATDELAKRHSEQLL